MQSPPRRERDEDANLWDRTMDEASKSQTPVSRRLLFARILKTCEVSNQLPLWDKYKDDLSEDYKDQQQQRFPEGKIEFSEEIYNSALIVIEDHVIDMGGEKLCKYGLPKTHRKKELSAEQYCVYEEIIKKVNNDEGGLFFLDGPAGTGKTYVIKLLLDEVRQRGEIALAVASTGIAATLLPGGRTVHDAFKLPFNLDKPVNKISEDSSMAEDLKKCSLIVWDEVTMSHKMALKCVNKTLKDLCNPDCVMGGVTVVFSGDFRQTLPVIQGNDTDKFNASLNSKLRGKKVTHLRLSKNMRYDSQDFADTILKLGEGTLEMNENHEINVSEISTLVNSEDELIEKVFPSLKSNYTNHDWLCKRAIMAPTNDAVDSLNDKILDELPTKESTYESIDSVIEYLNFPEPMGAPPDRLLLKVGAPITLIRHLAPPKLYTGTRLIVKKLMKNVIEATIISGVGKGEDVFIPRIPFKRSENSKRLQFPIRLSFAMTIHKSERQTLDVAGLYLKEDCFTHGQLYLGASRVRSKDNLFIFALNGKTKNIVYKEVLSEKLTNE